MPLSEASWLTRSSEHNERVSIDGEIGEFNAYKYSNEGVEGHSQRQKRKETELRRSAMERMEKNNSMAAVLSPVQPRVSLGTPSIRSVLSWHRHSALFHHVTTKVMGRSSTSEMQKETLWSSFRCKCSCATKKSIELDDQLHKRVPLKETNRGGIDRADPLLEVGATLPQKPWMSEDKVVLCPSARTSLLEKGLASPVFSVVENLSPKIEKSLTDSSISSVYNTFGVQAVGKTKKSMCHKRILNLLNWDIFSSGLADVNIPSANSVEYFTDAESDASSDLFEIDSFTGNDRIPSLSDQTPDSSAYCYTPPATCYAPSEANIDWAVNTVSAADFSPLSECRFKPAVQVVTSTSKKYRCNE